MSEKRDSCYVPREFELNDSSQSGSLFRFWTLSHKTIRFGARWFLVTHRTVHVSYAVPVVRGARHSRTPCDRKRRSPRRGTAVGPPGRGTMIHQTATIKALSVCVVHVYQVSTHSSAAHAYTKCRGWSPFRRRLREAFLGVSRPMVCGFNVELS